MMKQFKDPIYEYVDVEAHYIPIVNSAEFQRLRSIRQTGYASLYPSALHNRFVHSLGVFHLGKKAIYALRDNIGDELGVDFDTTYNWELLKETFILACLLHDIGHSPFSHTGESFYEQSTLFQEELKVLIGSSLYNDLLVQGYGKPHEAMSAMIGIQLLEKQGFAFEKEFFARAIMGVSYSEKGIKYQIRNCLISILNGDLIDVDKLDYLMRDAYVTGYSTMKIDYMRLLAGYTIGKVNVLKHDDTMQTVYKIAFKKGALSVLENITYANDLERRWIQSNPTILYDCKLVEHAIIRYNQYMMDSYNGLRKYGNVFNKVAISKEGFTKEDDVKLRLLCDDDIITYLKNEDDSVVSEHYFSRDLRYKPLWKSEGEYIQRVKGGIAQRRLERLLDTLLISIKYCGIFFLNQPELERLEQIKQNKSPAEQRIYDRALYLVKFFKDFAQKYGLLFAFSIVKEKSFISNREQMERHPIHIVLGDGETSSFWELMYGKERNINVSTTSMSDKHLFYVYTPRHNLEIAQKKGYNISELLIDYINANWPT